MNRTDWPHEKLAEIAEAAAAVQVELSPAQRWDARLWSDGTVELGRWDDDRGGLYSGGSAVEYQRFQVVANLLNQAGTIAEIMTILSEWLSERAGTPIAHVNDRYGCQRAYEQSTADAVRRINALLLPLGEPEVTR